MMHPVLKMSLMKIKGYAKKMKGDAMKEHMASGEGEEHEAPHAMTPGVANHEESTEVDPEVGSAVASEVRPADSSHSDKKRIRKMLGMK